MECGAGDFDVLKIVRAVGAEDGFFVAFAEEEDDVARFGEFDGLLDGIGTIWDVEEILV